MADYTMTPEMSACIQEIAGSTEQAAGRAAFGAAGTAELAAVDAKADANAADIATNASDIAANVVVIADNTQRITDIEDDVTARLIDWKGEWSPGNVAISNEMWRDGRWLGIANTTTSDSPSPQPSGDPTVDLPNAPAWATPAFTGEVEMEHIYTFTQGGWIKGGQIWPVNVSPTISYVVIVTDITDSLNPIAKVLPLPSLTAGQWNTVSLGASAVVAGTVLSVRLKALDSASETVITGDWNYAGIDAGAAPASGAWNRRNQQDEFRISYTDAAAANRTAQINSVIAGSTIKVQDDADSTNYWVYSVSGSQDIGTAREFFVSLIETGPGGPPTPGQLSNVTITVPTPASTSYVSFEDYWAANEPDWATVSSVLSLGGSTDPDSNDGFGIRMEFQPAYVSPSWDLLSTLDVDGGAANGVISLYNLQSFSGDFKSDGTVPMSGDLDVGSNAIDLDGATIAGDGTGGIEITPQGAGAINLNGTINAEGVELLPYMGIYFSTPAATTGFTSGVYKKAAGTTTITNKSASMDDNGVSNRIRYVGSSMRHFHIVGQCSVALASGTNHAIGIQIWRYDASGASGTLLAHSEAISNVPSTNQVQITTHADAMLDNGDYLELHITDHHPSVSNVTVDLGYLFAMGMPG